MERLCKTCNTPHKKATPYCSIECTNADPEFHEICRTAMNLVDAAKKCGISETTFRRITEELGIKITVKKKPPRVKVCPKCSKEHTSKYGIHCSKACANSRSHSEETKQKMREAAIKFMKNNPEKFKKFLSSEKNVRTMLRILPKEQTQEIRDRISNSLKEYYKDKKKSKEELAAKNRSARMAYYAKQKQATTEYADKKLIKKIYENLPEGYNVDHIIPITKGGLHHQDNLQYLPKTENCRKGNRLDYIPDGVIRWQDVIDLTNS